MSPCDPGRHVLFGSNLKKEGESAKQVKNRGQVPAEAWCAPAGRSPCPPWLPETCCSRPSRHPRASLCTCHLLGHTDRRPAVPSHASSRVSGQVQLRSSRRVGWHARVLCREHARGCSGSCRPRIRGSRGCSSSRPRGAGSGNRSTPRQSAGRGITLLRELTYILVEPGRRVAVRLAKAGLVRVWRVARHRCSRNDAVRPGSAFVRLGRRREGSCAALTCSWRTTRS